MSVEQSFIKRFMEELVQRLKKVMIIQEYVFWEGESALINRIRHNSWIKVPSYNNNHDCATCPSRITSS